MKTINVVAPASINKDSILSKLFPNYDIRHLTGLADTFITKLDLDGDKLDVFEINEEEFIEKFIIFVDQCASEQNEDILTKTQKILHNELSNWNCYVDSHEHRFKVIRADKKEIKNFTLHVLKLIISEHFLITNLIYTVSENNEMIVLSDVKTEAEFDLVNEMADYVKNMALVLIPFRITQNEMISCIPFADLTNYTENNFAHQLCDNLFTAFLEEPSCTDEQILNATLIGYSVTNDNLSHRPINCILVNMDKVNDIPNIEPIIRSDKFFDFVV